MEIWGNVKKHRKTLGEYSVYNKYSRILSNKLGNTMKLGYNRQDTHRQTDNNIIPSTHTIAEDYEQTYATANS